MRITEVQSASDDVIITVQDVRKACSEQKRNKAPGSDGIQKMKVSRFETHMFSIDRYPSCIQRQKKSLVLERKGKLNL